MPDSTDQHRPLDGLARCSGCGRHVPPGDVARVPIGERRYELCGRCRKGWRAHQQHRQMLRLTRTRVERGEP